MDLVNLLLTGLAVYVPNQLHFPTSLGIPGLNVFNVLFLICLAALFFRSRQGVEKHPAPLKGVFLFYYATMTLGLLITYFAGSAHLFNDITKFKTAVIYSLMFFVAFSAPKNLTDARRLFQIILFVAFVAAAETAWEGLNNGFGNFSGEKRASGPFGHNSNHSNYAGVFLGIFVPMFLAMALRKGAPLMERGIMFFAYAMGIFGVFATFSRQAFLALAVCSTLIAIARSRFLALAIVLVIANYQIWAPEGVRERIEMTSVSAQESALDEPEGESSAASRYAIWAAAWGLFKSEPLGVGFNQFPSRIVFLLPRWVITAGNASGEGAADGVNIGSYGRDAHNQFVLVMTECGIQGLIAFVALLLALLSKGIALARRGIDDYEKAMGTAFAVSVVGVILGNIYSSTFYFGEMMGLYWLFCGVMVKYLVLREAELEHSAPEEALSLFRTRPAKRPAAAAREAL